MTVFLCEYGGIEARVYWTLGLACRLVCDSSFWASDVFAGVVGWSFAWVRAGINAALAQHWPKNVVRGLGW